MTLPLHLSKFELEHPQGGHIYIVFAFQETGLEKFKLQLVNSACGNANTAHLLLCPQGAEVSQPPLRCLAICSENINPLDLILLRFPTSESLQLPVVWLLSACMMYIWEERVSGRTAKLANCKAEPLARLLVLKHTRWKHYTLNNSAVLLEEMIDLHFC